MAGPPMLVAVLFSGKPTFDTGAIARAYAALGTTDETLSDLTANGADALSAQIAEDVSVVGMMPAPLPLSPAERDRDAAVSARWWPDVAAVLRSHQRHAVVVPVRRPAHDSHPGKVLMARRLTRLAAAVAGGTPGSLGAQCAWSGVLRPTDQLLTYAADTWPTPFWCDLRVFGEGGAAGTARRGVAVRGPAALVGRDLQIWPTEMIPVETVIERAVSFTEYLFDGGMVLADGHTVGASATERFRVRHADDQGSGTKLLILELQQAASHRSQRRPA